MPKKSRYTMDAIYARAAQCNYNTDDPALRMLIGGYAHSLAVKECMPVRKGKNVVPMDKKTNVCIAHQRELHVSEITSNIRTHKGNRQSPYPPLLP